MSGMDVHPQPYAPYPNGTYTATESENGTITINSDEASVDDSLTQTEFDALFKKKPSD